MGGFPGEEEAKYAYNIARMAFKTDNKAKKRKAISNNRMVLEVVGEVHIIPDDLFWLMSKGGISRYNSRYSIEYVYTHLYYTIIAAR